MSWFDIDQFCLEVLCHNPADFLVSILDWDAFEEIAGRDSFTHGGRQFRLRRWSPRDRANRAAMRFHVRLCLKGLPAEYWRSSQRDRSDEEDPDGQGAGPLRHIGAACSSASVGRQREPPEGALAKTWTRR
jgi:hypothetical protein